MPVQRCTIEGSPGWKFGTSGTCYPYTKGDAASEKAAKAKAIKQGLAINGGKAPAEGFVEAYRLSDQPVEAGQTIPVMVFPIGEWKSSKYPRLPLTRELADELIANFTAGVLGTDPVVDSSGRHDESAPASGWIKRLYVAPWADREALVADVELTDVGAGDLSNGRYRYSSMFIAPHTDNETGTEYEHVLRSITFTNTPVLRLMPAVLDVPEAIAAADLPLEIACSEVSAAEGSFNELRDALERALGQGLSVNLWVRDFGDDWVVYETYAQDEPSETWRRSYQAGFPPVFGTAERVEIVTEYRSVLSPAQIVPNKPAGAAQAGFSESGEQVAPPVKRQKGKRMSKLHEMLKLAEDADEAAVDAAVVALAEDRDAERVKVAAERKRADAAETQLAETAAAERKASAERIVDELAKGTHITPAQKDVYLKLAESNPDRFTELCEASKKSKLLNTGEIGSGEPFRDTDPPSPADVELAELIKRRQVKDGIDYATAKRLVLSENPNDIRARYEDFRAGKEG